MNNNNKKNDSTWEMTSTDYDGHGSSFSLSLPFYDNGTVILLWRTKVLMLRMLLRFSFCC